jgi:phage-related protein
LIRKIVKPDPSGRDATVVFLGDSFDVISGFPSGAKRNLGHAIRCVQAGVDPPDSKPMTSVGQGVYELRDADEANWYRVIYLKKIEETVYVLHCFAKKSRRTPKNDLRTARSRLNALHQELLKEKRK